MDAYEKIYKENCCETIENLEYFDIIIRLPNVLMKGEKE